MFFDGVQHEKNTSLFPHNLFNFLFDKLSYG